MARRLGVAEAQQRLPKLIEEMRSAGESVEIEVEGRVVATLVPGGTGSNGKEDDPLRTAFADFDEALLDQFHENVREIHERGATEPPDLEA